MEPTERAKKLIDKYIFTYIPNYTSMFDVKQCALIAVDEIVSVLEEGADDFWRSEYWDEVKEEIVKL